MTKQRQVSAVEEAKRVVGQPVREVIFDKDGTVRVIFYDSAQREDLDLDLVQWK